MTQSKLIAHCKLASKQMRKDSLQMSFDAGSTGAHLGGGLSMIEIMSVLYCGVMNIKKENLLLDTRDRFILSKGHGVLALYTAMCQAGILSKEELSTFKKDGTHLYGHPSMDLTRGIEFSSGSLGQGLSLGVGSCLALKRRSNNTSRVFVLLGDGECDEGSVWEAASCAAHYALNNLVAIVDKNGLQYDGETTKVLSMDCMAEKWRSFGWHTIEVDGHNEEELLNAFNTKTDKPLAVIAHTVKGKGVSFMENNPQWHHAQLNQKQLEQALQELECET